MSGDRTATLFMLQAVQEWGQPEEERVTAVQAVLNEAGFDAQATCWPVFGGIWPKPCEGRDADAATAWLKELTGNLKRGDCNSEIEQIHAAIHASAEARRAAA